MMALWESNKSGQDSSDMVRTWILEHACKYQMQGVVTELMRRDPATLNFDCSTCGNDQDLPVNPLYIARFLCVHLLQNLDSILQKPLSVDVLHTIDTEVLLICAEVLESLYTQDHFIDFKIFYKVLAALKMLFLILLMVRNQTNDYVSKHLDVLFPTSTRERLAQCSSQYGLSEQMAQTHQQREKDARVFVLQLLYKENKRNEYMRKRMLTEVKIFLQCIHSSFPQIVEAALVPHMPETVIEKIVNGSASTICSQSDPAIKLLLEFVQPGFQEKDLVTAVEVLDPTAEASSAVSVVDITDTFFTASSQLSQPYVDCYSQQSEREPVTSTVEDDCSEGPASSAVNENAEADLDCCPSDDNDCVLRVRRRARAQHESPSLFTPTNKNVKKPPREVDFSNACLQSDITSSTKTTKSRKRTSGERNESSPGHQTVVPETPSSGTTRRKPGPRRSARTSPRSSSNIITTRSPVKKCSVDLYFQKDYSCDIGEFALFI